ncbi:MAG TPA: phytanoyl-CoA dioxygenase family protein [Pseudomonadales bacterium]|nr:phytanoyl-CoA dioxygenase family protein [Pseudomonadales bacterium]
MQNIINLTEQQKNRFDLLGYLCFPGLFANEISAIRAEFERVFKDAADQIMPWEHVVHHNRPRQIMPAMVEKSAMLHALACSEKISAIIADLVGEPFRLLGSDGNIYDCGTRWHTDITGLPYNCRNVKIIFYLDEMRAGEDAFRIIPGSHHHTDQFSKKLKKLIKTPEENLGLSITEVPCDEIPTTPGDVVIFDARAWHAVPYAGNRRRSISFLYVDKDYQGQAVSEDYQ